MAWPETTMGPRPDDEFLLNLFLLEDEVVLVGFVVVAGVVEEVGKLERGDGEIGILAPQILLFPILVVVRVLPLRLEELFPPILGLMPFPDLEVDILATLADLR